ncbi:transposase [Streptomyces nitrosporeus]
MEGTASYGAGFTCATRSAGLDVVEVNRPDRAERRRIGKSDPIDAYASARAALSGRASSAPKDDTVAGIRVLHNAARSAVKARTAALNQITHILVTGPGSIRAKFGQLKSADRTDPLARLRPAKDAVHTAVLTALKSLARRVKELAAEDQALTRALDGEVTADSPGLRAAYGVGPDTASQLLVTAGGNPERLRTEASFAALCKAAPVPASSGRTNRHRLSRGGDRAANATLYRIALVRMSSTTREGPSPHPRLRGTADCRRPNQEGDHPAAETSHSPGDVPLPDHYRHHPGHRRPAAPAAVEEHHPHRSGPPLRRLARHDLHPRTRNPSRRRPRQHLPRLAHRRLTANRSISSRRVPGRDRFPSWWM